MGSDLDVAIGTRFVRWFEHAACRDTSPDAFFDHRMVGGRPAAQAYRVARHFCATCPVINSCRREAEARGEVGIWGGQWRPSTEGVRQPIDLLRTGASVRHHPERRRAQERRAR
jgi:hypothetical protein